MCLSAFLPCWFHSNKEDGEGWHFYENLCNLRELRVFYKSHKYLTGTEIFKFCRFSSNDKFVLAELSHHKMCTSDYRLPVFYSWERTNNILAWYNKFLGGLIFLCCFLYSVNLKILKCFFFFLLYQGTDRRNHFRTFFNHNKLWAAEDVKLKARKQAFSINLESQLDVKLALIVSDET